MSANCSSIMIAEPRILHPKMTIKEVFPIIRQVGTRFLPVVDDAGDFVGTFSSMTLIKLLLPSSVSIKEKKNPCTPQTSIMEALNLLYHYHYHVVVLAPNSRQFLGVITVKGVLDCIHATVRDEE